MPQGRDRPRLQAPRSGPAHAAALRRVRHDDGRADAALAVVLPLRPTPLPGDPAMRARWLSTPYGWMLAFQLGRFYLVFSKDVQRGLPTSYAVRGWWE